MTIINFFVRSNLFLLHDLMRFQRKFIVAINDKKNCLRKYTCNVFCDLSRNVKCDLKNAIQICSLQRLFEMIHSRDHAWSSHRQFFDHLVLLLTNDACSFSIIEWRMSIFDLSSDVYDKTSSLTKHLIKLDENDSSNLTKRQIKLDRASHQTWQKRLIKLDESDSSNLTKETSSHQTWRKRHFIKLKIVISSNFWKERQFFYFLMRDLMQQRVIWKTKSCRKSLFVLREDKEAL
jgi:hypothetical protein